MQTLFFQANAADGAAKDVELDEVRTPGPRGPSLATSGQPRSQSAVEIDVSRSRQPATVLISIAGMTCAACVSAVESSLNEIPGVNSASVTLLPDPRGTVNYDASQVDIEAIVRAVENAGYEVVAAEKGETLGDSSSQLVRLQVFVAEGSGGFKLDKDILESICAVLRAVEGVQEAKIEPPRGQGANAAHAAIIRARYDPNVVGVRNLIACTSSVRQGLRVDVTKPPKSATSQGDLWNLVAGALLSILTFVVAMVGMMMLPADNSFRMSLETSVGGIEVGVLIVWVASTIMVFGVGRRFWKGAWNSLVHLHTANMDVLVVLGSASAYFFSVYAVVRDLASYAMPSSDMIDSLEPLVKTDSFFEAPVFIIFFVLVGKYIQKIATGKTAEAIDRLLQLQPDQATLVTLDEVDSSKVVAEETIKLELLHVGDVLKVVSGDSVPSDGVVLRGSTHIDESLLTGESIPVFKAVGDVVYGGTINVGNPILVRVRRVGGDTVVSKIAGMIAAAQSSRAKIQSVVDRISRYFVPAVIAIAIVAFIIWMLVPLAPNTDRVRLALEFAISVLVIACPCGLGLAVPTAIMVGTGVAAKHGILVREGGSALERAHSAEIFAFDKTGTLSVGKPRVVDSAFFLDGSPSDATSIWRLLGEMESESGHPLAKALEDKAGEELARASSFASTVVASDKQADWNANADVAEEIEAKQARGSGSLIFGRYRLLDIHETSGRGLSAILSADAGLPSAEFPDRLTCVVGNEAWMTENGCSLPTSASPTANSWRVQARTIVFLGISELNIVLAIFAIADEIRPDAREMVDYLHGQGKQVFVVTGDHSGTARAVGQQLEISLDRIISGVRPEDKVRMVEKLQSGEVGNGTSGAGRMSTMDRDLESGRVENAHRMVAFVGDGVNDAAALAKADLSIAMGAGSEIAISSAGVILMHNRLSAVAVLLDLSAATFRRIWINLGAAFVYNVIGIPIAAGALYVVGVRLEPWMAAIAMAASSISVVLSSLLLKLYTPRRSIRGMGG